MVERLEVDIFGVKVGVFGELKWRKIMKKYAEIAVKALL